MEGIDVDDVLDAAKLAGLKCSRPALIDFFESQGICYISGKKKQRKPRDGQAAWTGRAYRGR
eukprot:2203481-Pyramimonas_sp.AAC.1